MASQREALTGLTYFSMQAINIKKLNKVYRNGTVALKDVDFTINQGDFFGLIGANGAGKSTLIGILTGLVRKTSGTVEVFGTSIDEAPESARQYIGVTPQEFNFNIFEIIENTLINQAGYYGIPRSQAKERANFLLHKVGLWERRRAEIRSLSGGMKRRLMIARALVHQPPLLLLDEPTVGVDVGMRHSTWDYLNQLNSEGTTILLTSHNLEEIEQLCHNAAMIHKGQILKYDSVDNLIHSLEKQSYIAKLSHADGIENVKGYEMTLLNDGSLEVILESQDTLTHFVAAMHNAGISVKDIRPKRNRLEQLFLNLNTTFEDES